MNWMMVSPLGMLNNWPFDPSRTTSSISNWLDNMSPKPPIFSFLLKGGQILALPYCPPRPISYSMAQKLVPKIRIVPEKCQATRMIIVPWTTFQRWERRRPFRVAIWGCSRWGSKVAGLHIRQTGTSHSKVRGETFVPVSGQRHSNRDLHRTHLSENVELSTHDHSARGPESAQGKKSKASRDFYLFETWSQGFFRSGLSDTLNKLCDTRVQRDTFTHRRPPSEINSLTKLDGAISLYFKSRPSNELFRIQ